MKLRILLFSILLPTFAYGDPIMLQFTGVVSESGGQLEKVKGLPYMVDHVVSGNITYTPGISVSPAEITFLINGDTYTVNAFARADVSFQTGSRIIISGFAPLINAHIGLFLLGPPSALGCEVINNILPDCFFKVQPASLPDIITLGFGPNNFLGQLQFRTSGNFDTLFYSNNANEAVFLNATLNSMQPVPEPSTIILTAVGLGIIGGIVRKKQ